MIEIDPRGVKPTRAVHAFALYPDAMTKKNAGKASGSGKLPPWMPESMAKAGKSGTTTKGKGGPKPAGQAAPPRGKGRQKPPGPPRSRRPDPHADREAQRYD